jgi:L-erythro-3,5-diaminohexanoate dehydrogenase
MTTRPISEKAGDPFGTHRSLEPVGALPQPALRVNNDFSHLYSGEMLIEVETLNIDAASFRQMEEATGSVGGVAELVRKTVTDRGKQHNPVTGSGGMLLGRVLQLAPGRHKDDTARVGDRIATLTSLSLTPLAIRKVKDIRAASAQVDIEGEAVLFATSPYARLPEDMPERLAVAAMDVAGAAPQVARLVKPGGTVVVLGAGGKSGILCVAEARRVGGKDARIIGVESYAPYAEDLKQLGICTEVLALDARDPVAVRNAVLKATGGREADVTLSCVNVDGAEMSAILCTRDRGVAYFFAMSTKFTAAALGAEGVGKDVDLVIGNGYAHGHADHTLELLRAEPKIRALFETRYG